MDSFALAVNKLGSSITFQPRAVMHGLGLVVVVLAGAHLMGLALKQLGHERAFGLVRLFDMDRERNIPTIFSTSLFFLNSLLCFAVWRARRQEGRPVTTWLFLSGILLFLAVDESCQIHEFLKEPTKKLLGTSQGLLGPAWVIPYGVAALVLFALLLPFFFRLEMRSRKLFALSAAVFVGGAVGLEMLAGWYLGVASAKHGDDFNMMVDLNYGLFVVVEESFEMLGLIIFAYALLSLLQRAHGGLSIVLPAGSPTLTR